MEYVKKEIRSDMKKVMDDLHRTAYNERPDGMIPIKYDFTDGIAIITYATEEDAAEYFARQMSVNNEHKVT